MKTKKDLAKYLADYLEEPIDVFAPVLQKLIEQGLEAFESTEDVQILGDSKLKQKLADYKEGCEGLKLCISDLRPYADAYKRVCESLGIKRDILGYIKELKK